MRPVHAAIGAVALVAVSVGVTRLFDPHVERPADAAERVTEGARAAEAEHGPARLVLSDAARQNAHLEVATAGPGRVAVTTTLPGEVALDSDRLAHVTPRVSGTVLDVQRRLGDTVKRGDVLATVESRELAQMSGEARAAAQRADVAQARFKRVDVLYQDGVVAEKELLAARAALDEAVIARDAAGQMLLTAGTTRGGSYLLTAPQNGTIIEKHASVGEVVKADSLCFIIADLSRLWVDLTVYPRDLARVEVGQRVRIRAEGIDAPAEGTIDFLGAVAANEARATKARVVLARPGPRWRAGLFVTADIAIAERDAAVVVRDDAVQNIDGKPTVFVEHADGFEPRAVTLGTFGRAPDGTRVVAIASGMSAGERYVAGNAFVLKADLGKSEGAED